MLAIAQDGGVYPCPSLPVRLGDLTLASLQEIVRSKEKKEFRQQLLATPAACDGCIELAKCRGGCRGRGYMDSSSLDVADPSCGVTRLLVNRENNI